MGTQSAKSVVIDIKLLSGDAVKNMQDLNVKIANLKATLKGMKDAGMENSQTYLKLAQVLKDMQQSVKQNEKVLQQEIKSQKDAGDSINAMRANLKLLRQEYENLSRQDRESAYGKQMLQDIDNLTTALKKAEFAQQDYSRQIGEYQVAAQPAKQALREMRMECQNLSVALQGMQGKIQAQTTLVQTLAQNVGKETQEYKDAVAELDRLNKAYATTQDNLSKMERQAGELADTIDDSNQRIRSFANDQQNLAAMQEGVSVLTSAYTVLQGAMSALGMQSEELLQVYAKIQIVQQSINSLMTIYKALNKDSNLMVSARVKLERLRLQWTNAYNAALAAQNTEIATNTVEQTANAAGVTATTVAETAATATTFSLTAAFKALNTVIKANPIMAIASVAIAAISGLIAVIGKLRRKTKEAEEDAKKTAENMEKEAERIKKSAEERSKATESATKKYDEQITTVKTLLAVLRSEASAYTEKKKALAELVRLVPEYNGSISKTGKFIEGNIDAIDRYIAAMEKQARAQAYTELLSQSYMKQTALLRDKIIMEGNKKWYESQAELHKSMLEAARTAGDWETVAQAQKYFDWYNNKLQATNKALADTETQIKAVEREIKATEKLVSEAPAITEPKQPKATPKKGATDDTDKKKAEAEAKAAQKLYDDVLKVSQDFYTEVEKMRVASIKSQYELEKMRYDNELKTLEDALAKAKSLIGNAAVDQNALKKTISDLEIAIVKAGEVNGENMARIAQETNAAFDAVTAKLKNELDLAGKSQLEEIQIRLQQELAALEAEKEAELNAHEYTEEQKAEITRLYAEKRANLEKDAAKANTAVWMGTTQTVLDGMKQVTGAFSTLFSTLAENDEEMQKYANALALVDIMVNMAQGIAAAVAKGMEMGWPAAAVMIPIGIATVVSGIAEAIAVFKKANNVKSAPRFAKGGLVGGKETNRTDDSVTAKLSVGEYVIPSGVVGNLGAEFFDELVGKYNKNGKKHKKLPKLLDEMPHFATGGLVSSVPNTATANASIDFESMKTAMRESMGEALQEMPNPVVSVKEITNTQNRVRTKERISRT